MVAFEMNLNLDDVKLHLGRFAGVQVGPATQSDPAPLGVF
jgi:hypothetical protein